MEFPTFYKKAKLDKAQSVDYLLFGGLLVLLLLALIFWQERVFIIDASYQFFSLIEKGEFPIQFQRYGAGLVFSLPYLLLKLQAPFGLILIGYAISFTLYPILFYWLLKKFRLQEYAWMIALLFIFVTAHTFFWIQNEIIIATALAIFTVGLSSNWNWSFPIRFSCLLPLTFLTIYTHPLGVAPLLAAWSFLLAKEIETDFSKKRSLYFSVAMALAILAFVLRQFVLNSNSYDQAAMGMASNLWERLPNFFSYPSLKQFLSYVFTTQLPMVVAFALVFRHYLVGRNWWRLAAIALPFFGWLALIICTWPAEPHQFYIESYYLIFASILALPFVVDVLPAISKKWWIPLIGGMVLYRIATILIISPPYQIRLEYLKDKVEQVQQLPQERLLIQTDHISLHRLTMEWALSFETLLLSTYLDPSRPRTVTAIKGSPPDYCQAEDLAAIPTTFGPIGYSRLENQSYIQLQDTGRVEDIGLNWK